MQGFAVSIVWIVVLIFSAIFHEIMHGVVALYFGDHTAKSRGRLSLNPLVHLDMVGSVIIPTLLVLLKSPFVFGWAKPVPVDLRNVKKPYAHMLIALAGPMSNFLLAGLAGGLIRVFSTTLPAAAIQFLLIIVFVNCALGIFNLIPIPPLDGYYVIEYLFNIPRSVTQSLLSFSFVGILMAVLLFQNGFDRIIVTMVGWLTGVQ